MSSNEKDDTAALLADEIVRLFQKADPEIFLAGDVAKGEKVTVDGKIPMIWLAQGILRFLLREGRALSQR